MNPLGMSEEEIYDYFIRWNEGNGSEKASEFAQRLWAETSNSDISTAALSAYDAIRFAESQQSTAVNELVEAAGRAVNCAKTAYDPYLRELKVALDALNSPTPTSKEEDKS